MTERRKIGTLLFHGRTPRDLKAREEPAAALPPGSEVSEPDEVGVFEIALDAEDQEDALQRVGDAVAASGTDDHILFLEHADIPEHWRARSGSPG